MKQQDGGNDAAILFPDGSLTIKGERITVREYRFRESLAIASLVQPIVDALAEAFKSKDGVSLAAMRKAFAQHPDEVMQLIAIACDRPLDWVLALADEDSEALLLTWQTVNMSFFVRRVASELLAKQNMALQLAGAVFSSPSHTPASACRQTSASATPSVN